jgi:hypothetical protein
MIKTLNPCVIISEWRDVPNCLGMIWIDVSKKVKELIGGSYFSITKDYWTSLRNDNYSEITSHFMDHFFKLCSLVVSFEKHVGGCSEELHFPINNIKCLLETEITPSLLTSFQIFARKVESSLLMLQYLLSFSLLQQNLPFAN